MCSGVISFTFRNYDQGIKIEFAKNKMSESSRSYVNVIIVDVLARRRGKIE